MNDYGTLRRHILAIPFELVMAGAAVVALYQQSWLHLAASLFTLLISFAPLALERFFRLRLTMLVQATYVGFIFASMFAGEVFYMYGRIIIWDDVTHFVSGLLLGLGVMMWLDVLAQRSRQINLPVWLQAVILLCVTASVVLLWEIVEFMSDQLFGTTSQDNLPDTMYDMIYGTTGGLIMMMLSILHLKGRHVVGLHTVLERFRRLNK